MNKTVTGVLAFIAGAAVGSVATWAIVKKTYERIADEEIASMKEHFYSKDKNTKAPDDEFGEEESEEDSAELKENKNIIEACGYARPTDPWASKPIASNNKTDAVNTDVRIIAPNDFADDDYEVIGLTYYADGILAYDSNGEVIEDVNAVVGPDALHSFGEYDDDSVHVRNDRLQIDYEILLSLRNYSEAVFGSRPVDEGQTCETM